MCGKEPQKKFDERKVELGGAVSGLVRTIDHHLQRVTRHARLQAKKRGLRIVFMRHNHQKAAIFQRHHLDRRYGGRQTKVRPAFRVGQHGASLLEPMPEKFPVCVPPDPTIVERSMDGIMSPR